jgi:hypothetical protein
VNELKLLLPSLKVVIINGATHAGERGVTGRLEFVSAIGDFISANQQKSSR